MKHIPPQNIVSYQSSSLQSWRRPSRFALFSLTFGTLTTPLVLAIGLMISYFGGFHNDFLNIALTFSPSLIGAVLNTIAIIKGEGSTPIYGMIFSLAVPLVLLLVWLTILISMVR